MNIISEKKLENAVVELEIEVPVEKVELEYKAVFNKIIRNSKVDGFRKGKAPLQIVEKKYMEYANGEVAESLARATVMEAIEKASLAPIMEPKFQYTSIRRDEPFRYKAYFEVIPTVELGKYTDIKVEEKSCTVEEKDVDNEIDAIRERYSDVKPIDEGAAVENKNLVKFKLKRIDDVDADKRDIVEFRDYSIVVGKSKDEYTLDKHIIGMKTGEEKEVTISYPESYYVKEIAGKNITYLVQIAEISNVMLPELNDEFAKQAGYESAADMRTKTREQLEKFVKDRISNDVKNDIMLNIVENSKFDIPESMILNEMYAIFNKTQQRIGYRAESLEQFAMLLGLDVEEYKEKLREDAIKTIKHTLILSEVSKKEDIKVTDEKYKELLDTLSNSMGKTVEEIEKIVAENDSRSSLENDILLELAMDHIYNKSDIKKSAALSFDDFVKSKMGQ